MDELLHHCLRELSFDGDLGCDVSRLGDFIVGFYTHNSCFRSQTVDDAFHAFFWSVLVQHPTVLVGVVPPGAATEVYIAPQASAKRKVKAKGEELVEETASALDVIPDAKSQPLDCLKRDYGDALRIAVTPETSFAAITGSHIRSPKLSPMVYTALQFVTRGRENGISVVDLGKRTKYDQKTCFYLVKQLLDLGLIKKVRRGGVGSHFCIHNYFYERSPLWQQIREEEMRATDDAQQALQTPSSPDTSTNLISTSVAFDPMDARHLSSLPLVRARVVKLLKGSRNCMHPCNNILLKLGFSKPTKTDRRFFQTRIRELIQQGVIEKVLVPNKHKSDLNSTIQCFHLVASDVALDDGMVIRPEDEGEEDDDRDVGKRFPHLGNDIHYIPHLYQDDGGDVKTNVTIHKQIADLLEDKGMTGMTLNELSTSLRQFDKRTIDLCLNRAEKNRPPSHLSDIGIVGLLETHGRERRHRYYNVASYRNLVTQENLDHSAVELALPDSDKVGGFAPLDSCLFYENDMALIKYQDMFKDKGKVKTPGKLGRPRKRHLSGETKDASVVVLIETGGNNSKNDGSGDDVDDDRATDQPPKRKRGRPRKKQRVGDKVDDALEGISASAGDELPKLAGSQVEANPSARKRARPRKNDIGAAVTEAELSTTIRTALEGGAQGLIPVGQVTDTGGIVDGPVTPNPALRRSGRSLKRNLAISGITESAISPAQSDDSGHTIQLRPNKRQRIEPTRLHDLRQGDEAVADEAEPQVISDMYMPPSAFASNTEVQDAMHCTMNLEDGAGPQNTPIDPTLTSVSANSLLKLNDMPNDAEPISGPKARAKVNVSHLRRENELYRLIESFGGIATLHTKEFFEAHMALIQAMAQTGEATSSPVGTRLDKRTATATIDSLEDRGRVKTLKTSVVTPIGVNRPACVVYLPNIEQGKLNKFLADLGRNPPPTQMQSIKKIDERIEYGAGSSNQTQRSVLPLQLLQMDQPGDNSGERWSRNAARAEQLFSYDDATVRAVLLTERTTLGQLYGFIVGKALRARKFHLTAISALEKHETSSNIISIEHRIIHLSYFCHDLPLSNYCSLVASLSHDEDLTRFLETDAGKETLVRDLPSNLSSVLQIGRSRAKSRLLDTLDFLRCLKLVTPLQPSISDSPWITCQRVSDHPTAFDPVPLETATSNPPSAAPLYWHFNTHAPLHRWALSESSPPFWKDSSILSYLDACAYWQDLQVASTNKGVQVIANSDTNDSPDDKKSLPKSLRRTVSWSGEYVLTWHQIQYLQRFVDTSTGNTPIQDPLGGETQIQHISWVVSAPRDVVCDFFAKAHSKTDRKLQRKVKRRSEKKTRKAADAKARLSKKAAEAKVQREKDWEDIVQRAHPEPLKGSAAIRVRRVRTRFLQSGSGKDASKWEGEVLDAVREANMAAANILNTSSRLHLSPNESQDPMPPPVAVNPPEKSIALLITQQGPPLSIIDKRKGKTKDKSDSAEMGPKLASPRRRQRFQWNRDYDELARDASAIIKARCRDAARVDWAAFEQVFPAVPRNSVRQRLAHIKETPGNDAYLIRLEDQWHELWVRFRGTDLLPDDDPESPSNFDLIKHVDFLRKHVDKNALRVGFGLPHEKDFAKISASVEELQRVWEVIENPPTAPPWDFMWNATVEEGREKQLLQQGFTLNAEEIPAPAGPSSDAIYLAECALKMTFGTPYERYDSERASQLLHDVGEDVVSVATTNLLTRGILSKTVRDPQKSKPGRTLKISEMNQNALGGSIPRDTFQDALALNDLTAQQEGNWQEWPLLASEGDIAALFQLVSDDKVNFRIDTLQAQAARPSVDWNSKKADDDQIETTIHVRFHDVSSTIPQPPSRGSSLGLVYEGLNSEPQLEHGKTANGDHACCRAVTSGLVDCTACLEDESSRLVAGLAVNEKESVLRILATVQLTGSNGITKDQLLATINYPAWQVFATVRRITESSTPLLFWAGFLCPVLVSSIHLRKWTVVTSQIPRIRIFPRRWCDISGSKINSIWEAALKAVVGVILFRPGISQAELRWRLRSIYDRQELHDVLRHLQGEGFIKMRIDHSSPLVHQEVFDVILIPDNREEKSIFWWMGDNRYWYQV